MITSSCPKCKCDEFYANQVVTVYTEEFNDDDNKMRSIYARKPHGPFVCQKCAAIYEKIPSIYNDMTGKI